MAALTFDTLLKGLKQGAAPGPVYYLHGEEDVLKEEAVRALLERAVDPAARDFNVDARAAAELDPEALRALVDTPPMVAERRAVGVRQGATVFDLVDAALERRGADAARLAGLALEQAGMTGVRVVTALGTALLGTALARAELDHGTPHARLEDALLRHLRAARPYGLRDWREEATRFARWAGGWTRADLGRALRRTLAADRALKGTGTSDERGIIVQLVVEFAVPAREAA